MLFKCFISNLIGNSIRHNKPPPALNFFGTVFSSIGCHHDIDIDIKLLAIHSDPFDEFCILWNPTHLHKHGQMLEAD